MKVFPRRCREPHSFRRLQTGSALLPLSQLISAGKVDGWGKATNECYLQQEEYLAPRR